MKKYVLITLAISLVGMVLLSALAYQVLVGNPEDVRTDTSSGTPQSGVTVLLGSTTVQVEVVQTSADITRGLSGRDALAEGYGMLFVMPHSAPHKFWMPDMHFAIDIIWLNEKFEVVDITHHATPESYPETFTPKVSARYVLEVPSGFATTYGLVEGMQATIDTSK